MDVQVSGKVDLSLAAVTKTPRASLRVSPRMPHISRGHEGAWAVTQTDVFVTRHRRHARRYGTEGSDRAPAGHTEPFGHQFLGIWVYTPPGAHGHRLTHTP